MIKKEIFIDLSNVDAQWWFNFLFQNIQINLTTGCWVWQGSRKEKGYPYCTFKGRSVHVHRLIMKIKGHEIEFKKVLHKCDNPPCINPDHLFIGSSSDNMQDASFKGRMRNQNKGKTHCKRGHEFTIQNTYKLSGNRRQCKRCTLDKHK